MKTYIFAFLNLCLITTSAFAKQINVCPNCPYTTVTSAIASAVDGDELIIEKGHYSEGNIVVDKRLKIKGVGFPILDGNNETEILTITADGVHVEGLQIQNVGSSYLEDRAGIRLRKCKNFIIINNRLFNTFFGIYLEKSNDGIVEGNELIGEAEQEMSSGNAIHLWYCKRVKVLNNTVAHHRDGIYFEFVDDSYVEGNTSENNLRYGLHFMFSNDDEYVNNQFQRNGAGVAVMFSKNIKMYNNLFAYNWGKASFGLLLKEIYDAEIKHNHFTENTIGIFVEGSTRINYLENDFKQNGWAMKISGGCLDNTVSHNNFISNTFDLSYSGGLNNNSFTNNYWSDYSGYDLNRDGIGDVPHRPVKLFNYIVNETPEATVLLRSLFVDLINFSEKVSPIFTPKDILDDAPAMGKILF